jgi:hypothetical protein
MLLVVGYLSFARKSKAIHLEAGAGNLQKASAYLDIVEVIK